VQTQVATIDLARAVLTDRAEAGPIDQVEETTIDPGAALVIWTARLRTGRVADNRANASRVFKAAALIDPVAAEDPAVIASVAVAALAAEDLADLAAAAVADSAAAGSEAADEN
jgi:hypothetical protein